MAVEIGFSCDLDQMNFDFIHDFLTKSYWSEGISRTRMKRAMENSINVGAFMDGAQIGYARVVSDHATFAYLCDVFVIDSARGKGVSKKMMEYILNIPDLQGIKRFNLCTKDAHGLYAQFGWTPLSNPEKYMEIDRSGIYLKLSEV
jgi:N-acetylglutamate synthase-like GNAT family acetyltransferase